MPLYRLVPLAVVLAILSAPAHAAQTSGPSAEVAAVVDAAMSAPLSGDMARFRDQYAPDCVFVDEFAPFIWMGQNALDRWLASGGRMYQETGRQPGKPTFGPPRYVYRSGDRAFVVEPVKDSATVRGKPYAQEGAFAFSLSRVHGRWKITSQTWTKARETTDPY